MSWCTWDFFQTVCEFFRVIKIFFCKLSKTDNRIHRCSDIVWNIRNKVLFLFDGLIGFSNRFYNGFLLLLINMCLVAENWSKHNYNGNHSDDYIEKHHLYTCHLHYNFRMIISINYNYYEFCNAYNKNGDTTTALNKKKGKYQPHDIP